MKQDTQILFNIIEKGSQEEKLNILIDIGDNIELGYYKAGVLPSVVQTLVNSFSREKDLKTRRLLYRDISAAYMQKSDLSSVQFGPVLNILQDAEPNYICNVLQLLSMTYNKKYSRVVSQYLDYPDKKVREEALSALTSLQGSVN